MVPFVILEVLTYFCLRATTSGYIDLVNAKNAILLLNKSSGNAFFLNVK